MSFTLNGKESEIIEMAWCDRTSFDMIQKSTGLCEKEVILLMRQTLKPSSFRLWRKRVSGRTAKHSKKYRSFLETSEDNS